MGYSSALQLPCVSRKSSGCLLDLHLRLLVPGAEDADGEREECDTLPLQPRLVGPKLSVVCELDGVPGRGCAVLNMSLLAGVNSDQVETCVFTGGPGPIDQIHEESEQAGDEDDIPNVTRKINRENQADVIFNFFVAVKEFSFPG